MANHAIITGNIAIAPEIRHTNAGTPVANIRLAHNIRKRNDQGVWEDDHTVWLDVTCWKHLAEKAVALGKGAAVLVEGRFDMEYWEDNGQQRQKLILVAADIYRQEFVKSGQQQGGYGQQQQGGGYGQQAGGYNQQQGGGYQSPEQQQYQQQYQQPTVMGGQNATGSAQPTSDPWNSAPQGQQGFGQPEQPPF